MAPGNEGKKEEKEPKDPGKEKAKTPPAPAAVPAQSGEQSSTPPPEGGLTVEQEEPQDLEELIKIRKVIQGKKTFSVNIDKETELVMKEVTQDQLIDIDNALVQKKIALDSPSYLNELKLMKLGYSVIAIKFKGRELLVKGIDQVVEWLRGEGEGVMSALYLSYDSEISKVFAEIEKKS